MSYECLVADLAARFAFCSTYTELTDLLTECTLQLGFAHFAVCQHFHWLQPDRKSFRIHNYPDAWRQEYDGARLGLSDPIHRASHLKACGFRWREVPDLIEITAADRLMLERARDFDIADGFTIPSHVPGEIRGSVSFAIRNDQVFPSDRLLFAQAIGSYAFEAGRAIAGRAVRPDRCGLTMRQLECVMWVGRGKSNWEIAQILGVKEDTIKKHLQDASDRYSLAKRGSLPLRALYEGMLCFSDIFPDAIP
jgi:LuxR family transcriptional regulator, quorum-sensing system regulator CciR